VEGDSAQVCARAGSEKVEAPDSGFLRKYSHRSADTTDISKGQRTTAAADQEPSPHHENDGGSERLRRRHRRFHGSIGCWWKVS